MADLVKSEPHWTLSSNVVESYIFATSKQNLSIYSERLLMLLVKAAQCQVYGLKFSDGTGLTKVSTGPLGTTVEINVRELIGEDGAANYTYVKNAVKELMDSKHEHEEPILDRQGKPVTDLAGRQLYKYKAYHLVDDVSINEKPGVVIVDVNRHTWSAILDFSKGYRRYDLLVAMKLSKVYSLRMFKLVSNQQYPLTYTIEQLKEMWGISDKYKNTKDFMKVIASAKDELDKISPWTFEYSPVYADSAEVNKGRRGRKAITSIRFYPVKQQQFVTTSELATRVTPKDMLGNEIVDRLVHNLNFSMDSIKANLVLINACKRLFGTKGGKNDPDLVDFLIEVEPAATRARNCPGYVINALKRHLTEKYGYKCVLGKIIKAE